MFQVDDTLGSDGEWWVYLSFILPGNTRILGHNCLGKNFFHGFLSTLSVLFCVELNIQVVALKGLLYNWKQNYLISWTEASLWRPHFDGDRIWVLWSLLYKMADSSNLSEDSPGMRRCWPQQTKPAGTDWPGKLVLQNHLHRHLGRYAFPLSSQSIHISWVPVFWRCFVYFIFIAYPSVWLPYCFQRRKRLQTSSFWLPLTLYYINKGIEVLKR